MTKLEICLASRNITDDLVRDGFCPQFYYHYMIDFVVPNLSQHVGCDKLLFYESSSRGIFSCCIEVSRTAIILFDTLIRA